jgi:GNAT superfamily N-acetyltransferase
MESGYNITEEASLDTIFPAVRQGIRASDPPDVGERDWRPLNLALRNAEGALVGGLYGATMWTWLLIDGLWVAEEIRGRGIGRELLLAAEQTAIERGCQGAWLGTFDFQARGFYERLGYRVFSELSDFPPGHRHYHLRKVFSGR